MRLIFSACESCMFKSDSKKDHDGWECAAYKKVPSDIYFGNAGHEVVRGDEDNPVAYEPEPGKEALRQRWLDSTGKAEG